jgi:hypothetical protein
MGTVATWPGLQFKDTFSALLVIGRKDSGIAAPHSSCSFMCGN